MKNYLYLIRDSYTGLTKLGLSSNPMMRMKFLEQLGPGKLELLSTELIMDPEEAIKVEDRIRHLFSPFEVGRVGSRWFKLS